MKLNLEKLRYTLPNGLILTVFLQSASATTPVDFEVRPNWEDNYDIVANVQILSERQISTDVFLCGSEYEARVSAVVKGQVTIGQILQVKSSRGLRSSSSYRLYLVEDYNNKKAESQWKENLSGYPAVLTDFFVRKCGPGFVAPFLILGSRPISK